MIQVRYFAWVRERVGHGEEKLELPAGVTTVRDLMDWLARRDEGYGAAFAHPDVIRAALDHHHVPHDTPVRDAREVAFFPPMTGG